MALDVSQAKAQALQLESCQSDISQARKQLLEYRACIAENWQGREVVYILQCIDDTIAQLDGISKTIGPLATSIVSTATTIRREEEAAEAAARAERERQRREEEARKERERAEALAREQAAAQASAQQAAQKQQRIQQAQSAYDAADHHLRELEKQRKALEKDKPSPFLVFSYSRYKEEAAKLDKQIEEAKKLRNQRKNELDKAKR